MPKYLAEFLGTFWLVFIGCGAVVISSSLPGMGLMPVALAFGLAVTTMAYALGHISGGHFNPAVTVGAWIGGRMEFKEIVPYIASQCLGAIAAAGILYLIATGKDGVEIGSFATNYFGADSAGGYSLVTCFFVEALLTFFFVLIILGSTDPRAPAGFAPLAIGLTLAIMIMVAGPITNASFNPARSLGPAVFVGGAALTQLWLFVVAPVTGAILAGVIYRLFERR
jgi:aquaporin Z